MSLQAYVVIFSTKDPKDDNPKTAIPEQPEVLEAFKDYLGIPDEHTVVNMWPVTLEELKHDPGVCRGCGEECEGARLFCDDCSDAIASEQT